MATDQKVRGSNPFVRTQYFLDYRNSQQVLVSETLPLTQSASRITLGT